MSLVIVSSGALGAQVRDTLTAADPARAATLLTPTALTDHEDDYDLAVLDVGDLDALPDLSTLRPILVVGCDSPEQRADALERGVTEVLDGDELGARTLLRTIKYLIELHTTRTRLDEEVQRRDLMLRAANDGLWEWDLDTDHMLYSARWCQIVGFEDEKVEPSPQTWFTRVHREDIKALHANLEAHQDGRTPFHQFEHRIVRPDGQTRWVRSRALVRRDRWGRAVALAGSLTDINARKVAELNTTDELTGLPSRRVLIERLGQSINHRRSDENFHFSVLFLNLDRFKIINDSIGLDSADRVLAQLAQRLQSCTNDAELVCRYGGDEFVILMEGHDDFAVADALAKRINDTLTSPFKLDDHDQDIFTSASIGIANSTRNYSSATEIIRDATIAMSQAKRNGGVSSTFDAAMRQEAVRTQRTETQLREAIERQQFEVYYQPIVALGSCRLTGFEALVRWNHPKRGVIGPGEFIALAEETGLILSIGQFVLREACSQMATWHRRYSDDISISINLSGRQLQSPTIVNDILQVVDETGLEPTAIKLELTESTLIADSAAATRILARLRERGIQLYIDDFGTGYSSLSYLHSFAIDGLKIDKSFVDTVGQDERKAAIVPSIVGLAHNLGMGVVAEGVETVQQARELTLLDCAEAQGYLYSRPVPRDEAAKLIERRILCDEDVFK